MPSILIGSPAPRSGKTTTALGLADAFTDVAASVALRDFSDNRRALQWAEVSGNTKFVVIAPDAPLTAAFEIVDSPSDETEFWLDKLPTKPDLAIVIVNPSDGGVWHIDQCVSDLDLAGIPTRILIARVPLGDSTAVALRDPLDQIYGLPIFGAEIPERPELKRILAENKPLSQTGYGSPSHQQMFQIAAALKKMLGEK